MAWIQIPALKATIAHGIIPKRSTFCLQKARIFSFAIPPAPLGFQ